MVILMPNPVLLKELMKPGLVVAAVDEEAFWRKRTSDELKAQGVSILELSNIADLHDVSNVGAIIHGLTKITSYADVEPTCDMAVKKRVPTVIMATSTHIPQALQIEVAHKFDVDRGGVPVELVPGRNYDEAIELLAEGLFAMDQGIRESDSYRRFRLTPRQ